MRTQPSKDFITLRARGSSAARTLGGYWSQVLGARIALTERVRRRRKIPPAQLRARVADFKRCLVRVAPEWLPENTALARAAGVAGDDILLLNCLPPGFWQPPVANCTSFLEVGRTVNRMFKIRDERNFVQSFHIRELECGRRLQVGLDIGNLGYAHCFRSDGFAGGNDTGSPIAQRDDRPRLTDCHMLRYFAERARTLEEVPRLFETLLEKDAAGGAGPGKGCIFFFVDTGGGLVMETWDDGYALKPVRRGRCVLSNHFITRKAQARETRPPNANTLLRYRRMTELLRRDGPAPDPCTVFALSRDRKYVPHALCNDDGRHFWMTLSAQYQVVPRSDPARAINYVCCGNTQHSVYLPVSILRRTSYVPLLNGDFYRQADRLYRTHRCRRHMARQQKALESTRDPPDTDARCSAAYTLLKSLT